MRYARVVAFILLAAWLERSAFAQTPELKLDTGEDIYKAACIGCHGPNGKGQPETTLGFEKPPQFPDFSDCNGSTREKTFDWTATIHEGGPKRGWSEIMPSFADALSMEQIHKVTDYLRSRCDEKIWPLGEMNLPRTFFTEKAFPEDEAVLTTAANTNGPGTVGSVLTYERRFGVRNQLELSAPFSFVQRDNRSWVGGVGDFILGYKRVLFSNSHSGSILSLQGEADMPSGNRTQGLGSGVTTFGTFAAFGQRLPGLAFFQMMAGADLPTNTKKAAQGVFLHSAVGKTFAQDRGFGRIWTPMVEFLGDRDLVDRSKTNWDIVPQMQFSLSKRQHVMASVGVRTPMNNTLGRTTQVVFYLLWDWFDGGLKEGW
jgi:mono/diheme cytochrome c family protein